MRFLLVCDGPSDGALVSHIRRLLIQHGVDQPDGIFWTKGRLLVDRIRNGVERLGNADLLFVHRDTEGYDIGARYCEITTAIQDAHYDGPWVAIVPVRMTEAWLLLDEEAIRDAVRKPNGRTPVVLPFPHECERRANPKLILETALITASETRGRRQDKIRKEFPNLRRNLLENLPIGGRLDQLESWVRFRDDTIRALQELDG